MVQNARRLCQVSAAVGIQPAGRFDPGQTGERIDQRQLMVELAGQLDRLGRVGVGLCPMACPEIQLRQMAQGVGESAWSAGGARRLDQAFQRRPHPVEFLVVEKHRGVLDYLDGQPERSLWVDGIDRSDEEGIALSRLADSNQRFAVRPTGHGRGRTTRPGAEGIGALRKSQRHMHHAINARAGITFLHGGGDGINQHEGSPLWIFGFDPIGPCDEDPACRGGRTRPHLDASATVFDRRAQARVPGKAKGLIQELRGAMGLAGDVGVATRLVKASGSLLGIWR